MKNLKRIIALVCVAAMMLSMSVFAFEADEDVAFKITANKTEVTLGETFTVTLSADKYDTYENVMLVAEIGYMYDEVDVLGDDTDSLFLEGNPMGEYGDAAITMMDGAGTNYNGNNLYTFEIKPLVTGEITLKLQDACMMDASNYNTTAYGYDELTITVKAAEEEVAVSIPTTMTVNGKEYTDIPNAVVEDVAFENGVITGNLYVDYWKNEVKQPAKEIDAENFKGIPANVTGTGTASFNVAFMGVPTGVVITGLSFK